MTDVMAETVAVTPLADKVIVVTGAGSGIGTAIAELLTARGAHVVATDISPGVGADGSGDFFEQDVGSPASWEALEQFVMKRFGRLDGLVNNAGIYRPETIVDASVVTFRDVARVNIEGVLLGCQSALRLMNAGGSIVNIASAAALRPSTTEIAYGMSKAAVVNLTQAVARHCIDEKLQVRCNAVCPGGVATPMSARTLALAGEQGEVFAQQLRDRSVTGAIGEPAEIASVVAFMLSSEAAFMTGESVVVDGGYSL